MRALEPNILDITGFASPERYAIVLRWFDMLVVGERLWILSDRYPANLRRRLRRDRPDAFQWNAARQDKKFWIVVLTKFLETPQASPPRRTYWERMTEPLLDRLPTRPAPAPKEPAASRPRLSGPAL